jgi:hypothetical protein
LVFALSGNVHGGTFGPTKDLEGSTTLDTTSAWKLGVVHQVLIDFASGHTTFVDTPEDGLVLNTNMRQYLTYQTMRD